MSWFLKDGVLHRRMLVVMFKARAGLVARKGPVHGPKGTYQAIRWVRPVEPSVAKKAPGAVIAANTPSGGHFAVPIKNEPKALPPEAVHSTFEYHGFTWVVHNAVVDGELSETFMVSELTTGLTATTVRSETPEEAEAFAKKMIDRVTLERLKLAVESARSVSSLVIEHRSVPDWEMEVLQKPFEYADKAARRKAIDGLAVDFDVDADKLDKWLDDNGISDASIEKLVAGDLSIGGHSAKDAIPVAVAFDYTEYKVKQVLKMAEEIGSSIGVDSSEVVRWAIDSGVDLYELDYDDYGGLDQAHKIIGYAVANGMTLDEAAQDMGGAQKHARRDYQDESIDRQENALLKANLVDSERLGGNHCNTAEWVGMKNDLDIEGCFKSKYGESPRLRHSIPSGQFYKREVIAYEVDKALGFGLVPPTVERTLNGEVGSVQMWIGDIDIGYGGLDKGRRLKAGVLDYLLFNSDRHKGNYGLDSNGNLILIDNGLILPQGFEDGFRSTFAETLVGEPIPEDVMDAIRRVDWSSLMNEMRDEGIDVKAIDWFSQRVAYVLEHGQISNTDDRPEVDEYNSPYSKVGGVAKRESSSASTVPSEQLKLGIMGTPKTRR